MTLAIEKKLSAWVEAGLISAEQAEAIAAFESRQGGRNWVLLGFGAVGVVAVATGLVSLVAANWDEIPVTVKLVGYFVLQTALGAAFLGVRERNGLAREALLALFGLSFLAGIGLVGQVYNLVSEGWPALLFWCGLALPATLLARSRLLPHLWFAGLALALLIWIWSDPGGKDLLLERSLAAMGVAFVVTGLGLSRHPRSPLPEPFRRAALSWGFLALAASSVVASVWWAAEVTGSPGLALAFPWVGAALAGGVVFTSRPPAPPAARGAAQAAFLTLAASTTVPLVAPIEPHEVIGCILFLIIWTLAAVAAGLAGRRRLFDFATFAIAARLVVVYFEVFGSLSATGVGLIVSGLVILGAAYAWHRYRRRLAGWLGART